MKIKRSLPALLLTLFFAAAIIPKPVFADSTNDRIHFIKNEDSGGGSAIVIESNGHFGLVDTMSPGPFSAFKNIEPDNVKQHDNGTKVRNYLTALGCEYLDFVVITHNHSDHIGGFAEIKSLLNSKTIVFYKENKTDSQDGEEEADKNQQYYEAMLANLNGATGYDTTIYRSPPDDLGNDFFSNIRLTDNFGADYDTSMRHSVHFQFGDFIVDLFNLYNISYYRENMNSLIVGIERIGNAARVALLGDIEASRGDKDYLFAQNKPHTNLNPTLGRYTTSCPECEERTLERQFADVMNGKVDIVMAGHHGYAESSNSYELLNMLQPDDYIMSNVTTTKNDADYPLSSTTGPIAYLKNAFSTSSYYTSQSSGAIVVDISAPFEKYSIKNFSTSGTEASSLTPLGSYLEPSWKQITNVRVGEERYEHKWLYVDNNTAVKNDWHYIGGYWYHFDENGIMQTGLINLNGNRYYLSKEKNDETIGTMQTGWLQIDGNWYYFDEDSGKMATGLQYVFYNNQRDYYYFSEDEATYGQIVTGWKKVNENWYYFRKAINEISEGYTGSAVRGFGTIGGQLYYFRRGPDEYGGIASMATGLLTVNGDTYYFRESQNDISAGPEGSALKNQCTIIAGAKYCFGNDGKATSIDMLTSAPTTAKCNSLTYTGSEQTLTKAAGDGYTWSNNKKTNAGTYAVTATLKPGYIWSDESTSNKTIQCSIAKANIAAPTVTNYDGTYDGKAHTITVGAVSGGTLNYSTDNTTWSQTKPTRTEVGTTKVYIKVVGDSNHKDSSVTYGFIIIASSLIVGDASGDGLVNSAELLRIRQHLLGTKILTGANFSAADVTRDNTINSADLLKVRQYLLGKITSF